MMSHFGQHWYILQVISPALTSHLSCINEPFGQHWSAIWPWLMSHLSLTSYLDSTDEWTCQYTRKIWLALINQPCGWSWKAIWPTLKSQTSGQHWWATCIWAKLNTALYSSDKPTNWYWWVIWPLLMSHIWLYCCRHNWNISSVLTS